MGKYRYAARLNAFKTKAPAGGRAAIGEMIRAAGAIDGISAADLNYPDHFKDISPADLRRLLEDSGLELNGLAMRYYGRPEFALGAFTHPEPGVRRAAIELTRRALDTAAEMNAGLLTYGWGRTVLIIRSSAITAVSGMTPSEPSQNWLNTTRRLTWPSNTNRASPVPVHCCPMPQPRFWPSGRPAKRMSGSRSILPIR